MFVCRKDPLCCVKGMGPCLFKQQQQQQQADDDTPAGLRPCPAHQWRHVWPECLPGGTPPLYLSPRHSCIGNHPFKLHPMIYSWSGQMHTYSMLKAALQGRCPKTRVCQVNHSERLVRPCPEMCACSGLSQGVPHQLSSHVSCSRAGDWCLP